MREAKFSTRQWIRLTNRDEREWRDTFVILFEEQLQKILERGRMIGFDNVSDELPGIIRDDQYKAIYQSLYMAQGQKYYEHIKGRLKGYKPDLRAKELPVGDPYFYRMQEFIDYITATKVQTVEATSREAALAAIKRATEQAIQSGVGEASLIAVIEQEIAMEWRILSEFRAQRIARTEVTALANRASFFGAAESGLTFMKRWEAFLDSRTRATHVEVHGLEISQEDRFPVGNSLLEYPGQYGVGSAEEVINCRCRLSYIVE